MTNEIPQPKSLRELAALDRDYEKCGLGDIWMSSKRRAYLLSDLRRLLGETRLDAEGFRQPFTAPYTFHDLLQLDALMLAIGMDWDWRRSSARSRFLDDRDRHNAALSDSQDTPKG